MDRKILQEYQQKYGSNSIDILVNNQVQNSSNKGRLFKASIDDLNRIYDFLKSGLPKEKAITYSKQQIRDHYNIPGCNIICIEKETGEIIGINISYPAVNVHTLQNKLDWSPKGGFDKEHFDDNTIYSELRAIKPEYQNNGVGNLLRSKQILDITSRGYNNIALFSLPESVNTNLSFGFGNHGITQLIFDDNSSSQVYLMKLNIQDEHLKKAMNIFSKYSTNPL